MKALILAAGKGTRLGELTHTTPKPMLPVQGRPLLAHTIDWLREQGVVEIAINLHHAAEVIQTYFGDGSAQGVQITYSYEPELLGTAGAARKLQPFLDERFALIYGDVYTNLDLLGLEAWHLERMANATADGGDVRCGATLALYRVPNPWECGLVDVDSRGRILRFVEKPPRAEVFTDLANSGILVVEPGVLDLIPPATVVDFGRDVLPGMLDSGLPLFARPIADAEVVIDIGTPAAYALVQSLASDKVTAGQNTQHVEVRA